MYKDNQVIKYIFHESKFPQTYTKYIGLNGHFVCKKIACASYVSSSIKPTSVHFVDFLKDPLRRYPTNLVCETLAFR